MSRVSDGQRAVQGASLLYQERSFALFALLTRVPEPQAQQVYLDGCLAALQPILSLNRLPAAYVVKPGPRLRTRYGQCRRFPGGRPPEIQVRCTRADDPQQWRRPGALAGTLIHELAHLRHPNHRPRFWALCCLLLDQAAAAGIYDPLTDDPSERAQGDTKLAASAAQAMAESARRAAREAYAKNRSAIGQWRAGQIATIKGTRLAGNPVTIIAKRRTRLEVRAADGRLYLVPAALLDSP